MANEPKFLLGRGESLNTESRFRGAPDKSDPPYPWAVQRAHLAPMFQAQQLAFDGLPANACPDDSVVSMFTMHPKYFSRSNFPSELLAQAGLRLVGSKPANVKPRNGRGSQSDEGVPSTVLFVAGQRMAFRRLADAALNAEEDSPLANELVKIEALAPLTADERLMGGLSETPELLEVVLHHDAELDVDWEDDFVAFADASGVHLDKSHEYQSRGLWFLPATADSESAHKLAQFSFVRAIRPMPKLRPLKQPHVLRSMTPPATIALPTEDALDSSFRVAVFDGGLPEDHPFRSLGYSD